MNPVTATTMSGIFIKTYDSHGDLIDRSVLLEIDATNLQQDQILDSDISYSLSLPAARQISDYTFKININTPMEIVGECYVKFTFPQEIDISGIDLDQIQGKGLFIDRSGSIKQWRSRYINNQYNLAERWIFLDGCQFDPSGKSEEQQEFFIPNQFEVTFKGLVNPSSVNVSPMSIQVYKKKEIITNILQEPITETTSFVIDSEMFNVQGEQILDAAITTSGQTIGVVEGNVAEISFSPPSGLIQESGQIKITCPQWAIDYEFDIEMKHIEYPHKDNNIVCTSDAF